jgi:hypothetical protein
MFFIEYTPQPLIIQLFILNILQSLRMKYSRMALVPSVREVVKKP